jgi:glycosyltransferase involved in cell wall biosynthesis
LSSWINRGHLSKSVMKVLHIVKYYFPSKGGMETYVKQLCEGLQAHGIRSSVLALNHETGKVIHSAVINGIQVFRVRTIFKFCSQPVAFSLGSRIKKLLLDHDLVHLNCPFPNVEIFSGILAKKPLVTTWQADPAHTRWGKFLRPYRPILNRLLERASRIVVTSPNLLDNSPSLSTFREKCEIIPLSCKLSCSGKPSSFSNEEKPTILFVGALRHYKGVEYLIRAMRLLGEAKLKIIGIGEEENRLRRLAADLHLQARVSFLGNISDDELSMEYAGAYLLVLPSISPSEAFGIVQLEAMSCGIPVINTDIPSGAPFVSLHGLTGLTVPPKNEVALAAAINLLLKDKELHALYSKNAFSRAKDFSEERMIASHARLYNETCEAFKHAPCRG